MNDTAKVATAILVIFVVAAVVANSQQGSVKDEFKNKTWR